MNSESRSKSTRLTRFPNLLVSAAAKLCVSNHLIILSFQHTRLPISLAQMFVFPGIRFTGWSVHEYKVQMVCAGYSRLKGIKQNIVTCLRHIWGYLTLVAGDMSYRHHLRDKFSSRINLLGQCVSTDPISRRETTNRYCWDSIWSP